MSLVLLKKIFYRDQKKWEGSFWFQIFKKKMWAIILKKYSGSGWFKYLHRGVFFNRKKGVDVGDKLKVLNINKNFNDFKSSFIFLNDRLIYKPQNLYSVLCKKGVEFLTTYKAVLQNTWWLQKYIYNVVFCNKEDLITSLNSMLTSNGFVLYVRDGVKIENPLTVYFYYSNKGGTFCTPNNLVVLGSNSECSVSVYYKTLYKADSGLNSLIIDSTNTVLNKNSYLNFKSFKHLEGFNSFQSHEFIVYQKAFLKVSNLNIKTPFNFLKNQVVLKGHNSKVNLTGLNLLGKGESSKNIIKQVHLVPNCKSDILFKNVISGESKSTFSGLILIDKKASETYAKQLNNNMCLGGSVEVYSIPKLEILSNSVRCLHGATVGGLNSLDTLYVSSRCINKKSAAQLFILGFINGVLKDIIIKKIKKLIYKRVEFLIKKLYTINY